MKNKLFNLLLFIAIAAGLLPAGSQLLQHWQQVSEAKLSKTPLLTAEELSVKFEKTLQQFKSVKDGDDFFLAVIEQKDFEAVVEKFNFVHGNFADTQRSNEIFVRRLWGAMSGASNDLRDQFGSQVMGTIRAKYDSRLEPFESTVVTTTSCGLYTLYWALWTMSVMFLVFVSRAKSLNHLVNEAVSGRLLFASILWVFFYKEYMMVQEKEEHRNVGAMAKLAAVNTMFLLTFCLSVATSAQTNSNTTKKGNKASMAIIIDQSAEAAGGKNPEGLIFVSRKKEEVLQEAGVIYNQNGTTGIALTGYSLSTKNGVQFTPYGGYRFDLKKDKPDAHRFFFGVRMFKSIKLNEKNALQFNIPFTQFEQYVKPKMKKAFFSAGQVFNKYKDKFRLGVEYTFRKEEKTLKSVSVGPFGAFNFTKNARIEGWLPFSNTGPPRFRLRTVITF